MRATEQHKRRIIAQAVVPL